MIKERIAPYNQILQSLFLCILSSTLSLIGILLLVTYVYYLSRWFGSIGFYRISWDMACSVDIHYSRNNDIYELRVACLRLLPSY